MLRFNPAEAGRKVLPKRIFAFQRKRGTAWMIAVGLLCFNCGLAWSQVPEVPLGPQNWASRPQTDALTGQSYVEFELPGKFLDAPSDGSAAVPRIKLRCDPTPYHRLTGKFLAGFINVGAVIDLTNGNTTTMQFRLDDGKPQNWFDGNYSTDYQAIAFDALFLNNILWGHILPHKPGTGAPVRKLVVAVQEHLGSRIVMQFDMPDPAVVMLALRHSFDLRAKHRSGSFKRSRPINRRQDLAEIVQTDVSDRLAQGQSMLGGPMREEGLAFVSYHWVTEPMDHALQREVFRYFIEEGVRQKKIVNIHAKGAETDVNHILGDLDVRRAIVHWYSGPLK
jgi:hypothetical protein